MSLLKFNCQFSSISHKVKDESPKMKPIHAESQSSDQEQPRSEPHNHHGSSLRHRIVHFVSEFIGMKVINIMALRIEKTLAKKALSKRLLSNSSMVLLERVVKKSGRKIAIRVLQRIGRGFVLSIPLLGGLLAVISSRNDYQRSLKERKQNNQRVEVHKENSNDSKLHLQKMAPYKYFLISSMFNGLDAVLNCGMLYFMIQQRNKAVRASDDDVHDHSGSIFDIVHQLHNALVSHTLENETIIALLEVGSIASAITATCVAILGEVVSTQTKINEKLEKQL